MTLTPWYPPWHSQSAEVASDAEVSSAIAAKIIYLATAGPPSTGTHAVKKLAIDPDGVVWVCTVAGTPGTWVDTSSGQELAYAEDKTTRTVATGTITDYGIASGSATLTITFTMPNRPVVIEANVPNVTAAATVTMGFFFHFASPNRTYGKHGLSLTNGPAQSANPRVRLPIIGEYEPAAGDSVTCKLQWNEVGGTVTSTTVTTGNNRLWPWIRAVAQ